MPRTSKSNSTTNLIFAIFVGGMLVLLALPSAGFLPGPVKTQVGRNSEAFAFALLVAVDIWLRRSTLSKSWLIGWWSFLVAGYLGTELGSGLPTEMVTLSEAFLGAMAISIFLGFYSGNPSRRGKWMLALGALVIALIGELPIGGWETSRASGWITDNAETLGFVALGSIALGYTSRYPWREVNPSNLTKAAWVAFLVITPIGVALVNPHGVDSTAAVGIFESTMVWIQRITEPFLAALFLTVYLWIQAAETHRTRGSSLLEGEEPLHS